MVLAKLKSRSLLFSRKADCTKYTYDQNGNQTLEWKPVGTRTTYSWEADNYLTCIRLAGVSTTYTYSSSGLRIQKDGPVENHKIYWDGVVLLAEEINSSHITFNTTLPAEYGQLISSRNTNTAFMHYDGQCNTRNTTVASEQIDGSIVMKSFGNIIQSSFINKSTDYLFVGANQYTTNINYGIVLDRNIAYSISNSRWLSNQRTIDSLTYSGYSYGRNNPLRYYDIFGSLSWEIVYLISGNAAINWKLPARTPSRNSFAWFSLCPFTSTITAPEWCANPNKKKCGVELLRATFSRSIPPEKQGTAFWSIELYAKFKSGGDYDPCCCEYCQNVRTRWLTVCPNKWRVFQGDFRRWFKDDGYDRFDHEGSSDCKELEFRANDNPGLRNVRRGCFVYWEFTIQPTVFDICNKRRIIARAEATVTVAGFYPDSIMYFPDLPFSVPAK